jgi:hypothetical protein
MRLLSAESLADMRRRPPVKSLWAAQGEQEGEMRSGPRLTWSCSVLPPAEQESLGAPQR